MVPHFVQIAPQEDELAAPHPSPYPCLSLSSPLQLCNTLRAMGKSSAGIADTVFQVSRSMGVSLCKCSMLLLWGNYQKLDSNKQHTCHVRG